MKRYFPAVLFLNVCFAGSVGMPSPFGDLEGSLADLGFVRVSDHIRDIRLDIKYSTTDNFMGSNLYGSFTNVWLRSDACIKLSIAQKLLKAQFPDASLKVYDGFRPRRIQRAMWALVVGTSKAPYVANPEPGSVHNFGAAVDLTIVDRKGVEWDMGTPYDFFGPLAEPQKEARYLQEGQLKPVQVSNRHVLKHVMVQAGFHSIPWEWWHFDAIPLEILKTQYKPID